MRGGSCLVGPGRRDGPAPPTLRSLRSLRASLACLTCEPAGGAGALASAGDRWANRPPGPSRYRCFLPDLAEFTTEPPVGTQRSPPEARGRDSTFPPEERKAGSAP